MTIGASGVLFAPFREANVSVVGVGSERYVQELQQMVDAYRLPHSTSYEEHIIQLRASLEAGLDETTKMGFAVQIFMLREKMKLQPGISQKVRLDAHNACEDALRALKGLSCFEVVFDDTPPADAEHHCLTFTTFLNDKDVVADKNSYPLT